MPSGNFQPIGRLLDFAKDFSGAALLTAVVLLLIGGGICLVYEGVSDSSIGNLPAALTAVLLWWAAMWLGKLARYEFADALGRGRETAAMLTQQSIGELFGQSVLAQREDIRSDYEANIETAREEHEWAKDRLNEFPNDSGLLYIAGQNYLRLGIATAAEEALRKISTVALSPNAQWLINLTLAQSLYLQNRWEEAERLCAECLQSDVSCRRKAIFIDRYVCHPLFHRDTRHFGRMETWARKGLEIDPRNISLKGTLGGILAEQGRREAEPLLTRSLRSKAPHDRALSMFYLGILRQSEGDCVEAKRSFEKALSIWSAPWFVERIRIEMVKLESDVRSG